MQRKGASIAPQVATNIAKLETVCIETQRAQLARKLPLNVPISRQSTATEHDDSAFAIDTNRFSARKVTRNAIPACTKLEPPTSGLCYRRQGELSRQASTAST
jgi:hypothetical protein